MEHASRFRVFIMKMDSFKIRIVPIGKVGENWTSARSNIKEILNDRFAVV